MMLISAEKPKSQAANNSPKMAAAVMMLQTLLEDGLTREAIAPRGCALHPSR
jgi:hypothetical protein